MIKIVDKSKCSGCYACKSICPQQCISMESDEEGFWYPVVDTDKCINCGLCQRTCPILNKDKIENNPCAYACFNKDERTRIKSSSGGIFSLIAEHVIDMDGVVFGAEFDEEFAVRHSFIKTKDQINQFQGSKYTQSKIGDTFKQAKSLLEQGKAVLFSGTSCQIAGLKSYLGKSYKKLFCVDIVCHGVPSPKVWNQYVLYREKCAGSKVSEISFRKKDPGWRRFSMYFKFMNNSEYLQPRDSDSYMKAFLRNLCLRPSCYACSFKTLNRQSDITLADFWGIESVLPRMDDDKGISLIFVNSKKGRYIFEKINNSILYEEVDINKAASCNYSALKSAPFNKNRKRFFRKFERKNFDKLVNKCCSDGLVLRIKRRLKMINRHIKG